YINGEAVRFLDGIGTATKSGDEVSIVPAVAGGN
ncbi:MAG: MoaD/ThiS family protein, partial [Chloroflexi bacterium]|nr:MoaD/ThiS family protein [Chloroflexota bacterium]